MDSPVDRDEFVVRETITEEFVLDGDVIARETISETVEVEVQHAHRREITVEISSGLEHRFPFRSGETVGSLLQAAVQFFAGTKSIDPSQPYILVYNKAELDDGVTLQRAGVDSGDELLLTPKRRPVDGRP
jgi:hypothetical protein